MNARIAAWLASTGDGGTTTLEEFLAGDGSDRGEQVARIGRLLGIAGTTVAVGVVIALIAVVAASRRDHPPLLRTAQLGALLVLVGGIVEVAGRAVIVDESWVTALTDEFTAASMMRIVGGLLGLLGLAAGDDGGWRPDAGSAFGLGGLVAVVVSFGFDGHTVSRGPRAVHLAVDAVHVAAGSAWFGGIVALLVVAVARRRRGEVASIGTLVVRFSPVATLALAAVAVAGVLMTLMILPDRAALTASDWGRLLVLKVAAVVVAVLLGAYQHLRLVPALDGDPDDPSTGRATRTTLAIEAIVLAYVVVITAFLVGASPGGG